RPARATLSRAARTSLIGSRCKPTSRRSPSRIPILRSFATASTAPSQRRNPERSATHQRVARLEPGERRKIAVGGPEFGYAMVQTKRGHTGIMDARSLQPGSPGQFTKFVEVPRALRQELQIARRPPGVHRREGRFQESWRMVDTLMGDNGDKLVNAGPGHRPNRASPPQLLEALLGCRMKFAVLPVRVNQQIGINGDHEPEPRPR